MKTHSRKASSPRLRAVRTPNKDSSENRLSCSVDGCSSLSRNAGMCAKHYQRVKLGGSTECRVNGKTEDATCVVCGSVNKYKPSIAKRIKCCSRECSGKLVAINKGQITHGNKAAKDSYYSAIRRSRISSTAKESINPIEVFEESNWICYICGIETLKSKRGTAHARAPELDHMISLKDGGKHIRSNVACACRKCNNSKGSKSYRVSQGGGGRNRSKRRLIF